MNIANALLGLLCMAVIAGSVAGCATANGNQESLRKFRLKSDASSLVVVSGASSPLVVVVNDTFSATILGEKGSTVELYLGSRELGRFSVPVQLSIMEFPNLVRKSEFVVFDGEVPSEPYTVIDSWPNAVELCELVSITSEGEQIRRKDSVKLR